VPQIVSLLPTATAMPAATPALSPAPAPGTLLPPDLTSPNFLAQFKSALKTLAKVVVPPQLTQRPPTDPNAGPLMSPVTDGQPEAPAPVDTDKDAAKHAASLMPALLADLGFAVVPPAFPMPVPPNAVASGTAGAATQPLLQRVVAQPQLPQSAAQAQVPQSAAQAQVPQSAAQPQLPQSAAPVGMQPEATLGLPLQASPVQVQAASDPQLPQAPPETHLAKALPEVQLAQPLPDAQLGQALADLQLAQALPEALLGQALPLLPPQTAPVPLSRQPLDHLKPADQPLSPVSAAMAQPSPATAPDVSATVMLQPAPGPHQPTAAAPAATQGLPIAVAQQASKGGSQSGSASSDHGRHTPDKSATISSEVTPVQSAPASDVAMAAAAATTMPASTDALPVQVGPSQVASQIANHADLIRLPGNQGLQIQLHPDDLGGVQVTVRYSPTGGVELHINAEHAATGALVQAGWGELRDALATQGISPDRLVLSVTGPSNAGQADLSGGGGNRSDPSSYGSNPSGQGSLSSPDGQGQGQSRQDNPQQRSPGWNASVEPVSSPDSSPRVAPAIAVASRIDYRV
jgi:Flagellar hook-length control protein FliK